MSFVHLQCHSYYSFMRGVSSPEELIQKTKARGMNALALTDINGLYAAVWFWEKAREHGVSPILGAELCTEKERAVLLAKSAKGYARLCRILTERHLDENFSLAGSLLDDAQDLVALSSDLGLLKRLVVSGFKGELYVALPAGRPVRGLLRFAKEHGLPPAATADVYFAEPEDYSLHKLLRAIDMNVALGRVPPEELAPRECWLASPEEMKAFFAYCPEAIANTVKIAEQCIMTEPPWNALLFPAFNGLSGEEAFRLLREKALAGARRRYGRLTAAVRDRLTRELQVIREKGFAGYFLVVEDIVSRFPMTCGRGSAAASIVSYCLGITHVDPLRHDLFFERFLNPGRKDPPDIDVDFPWDERDRVLDYVFKKYGERNAAMVANHVCFQARAAVRETAKVYGLPEAEINRVTRKMRGFWRARNAEELVRSHPAFKGLRLTSPWPEILKLASRLEGIPRHLSVHCGGVVIAPEAPGSGFGLPGRVPLQCAAKGVNIIQWEKDQAEEGGLVKIDLLGNRSLAVVRDALAAIAENHGRRIEYQSLDPLSDPDTQALLARGDTMGVFYVESPAMRLLQKKTRRGDFEHLVIHSSIIRPAANEFIREYVRRLHGGEYQPLHPLLDELLKETHGIMCYQEDVTKAAMALAGFDADQGNDLRKILTKKHKTKKLAQYKEQFFKGAKKRGLSQETIKKIWEMILSFSGYSFCKPHSASYALVSFKSAWLRAHYPAEFMAAVISNQGGYYSTFAYISEARRMGLQVLGPDINKSEQAYTGKGNELRVGLMQIKGLSRPSLESLLEERKNRGPYGSFKDFIARVALPPSDLKLLVKAGCFDELEGRENRSRLLWAVERYASARERARTPALFAVPEKTPLPEVRPYDEIALLRQEVEALGFIISRHPLSLYLPRLKPLSYVPAKDLPRWVGHYVTTVGWYVTGKMVETKNREPMEFLSFEDTTAIYDATFFPPTYARFCRFLDPERPVILKGRVEEDFTAVTLTVDKVEPLAPRHSPIRLLL